MQRLDPAVPDHQVTRAQHRLAARPGGTQRRTGRLGLWRDEHAVFRAEKSAVGRMRFDQARGHAIMTRSD